MYEFEELNDSNVKAKYKKIKEDLIDEQVQIIKNEMLEQDDENNKVTEAHSKRERWMYKLPMEVSD